MFLRGSLIALILLFTFAPARAQFTATPTSPVTVGLGPQSVIAADFNNDGRPDLAIANATSNTVSILLNNGSGAFTGAAGSPIALASNPQSLAVADLNGDGKLDLVIACANTNTITVLLGNGAGGFTPAASSPFAVGASPSSVLIADVNDDGKLDLLIANSGDSTLSLLLGNGNGGFTALSGSPLTLSSNVQAMALADLNKDGYPDLVLINSSLNSVSILLGDGTGHFHAPVTATITVGSSPSALALADMNNDGKVDILVANSADNTVSELLGDGTGAFTVSAGSPFPVAARPSSLAVADFNNDGLLDFVTANSTGNNVSLLLGTATGSFTAASFSPFTTGTAPVSLAVADLNGDGKPDVVVANSSSNNITVLLNTLTSIVVNPASLSFFASAGHSSPAALPVSVNSAVSGPAYTVTSSQPWLAPTPTNNPTGSVSTVQLTPATTALAAGVYSATVRYKAANYFDGITAVTLNSASPTGTLLGATNSPFSVGNSPQFVAVADVNNDGKPDLIAANYSSSTVSVLLGDGTGKFVNASGSPFTVGTSPSSLAFGDFNGDGKLDIVTANSGSNNVTLLLGNGAGGFTAAPAPFAVGTNPFSILASDVNGDGKLDFITINANSNNFSVLLGNGFGGFTAAPGSPTASGTSPNYAALADFNGDGKPDLAITSASGNIVLIFFGNGAGGFSFNGFFTVGSFPQSVVAQDLNSDGRPDLLIANYGDNTVTVLLNNGASSFTAAPSSPFAVGSSPQNAIIADVNGDGKPDIISANLGDNTISILLGNGSGGFTAAAGSPFASGPTPSALAQADFNNDGSLDLAIANTSTNNVTVLLGSPVISTAVLTTTAAAPIAHGAPAPLTLTVTPGLGSFSNGSPAGTATFLDGTTVLGNSTQTTSPYTYSAILGGGTHALTATYNGDTANAASTSASVSVTVLAQTQTITFAALTTKTFNLATITVTATASSGLAVAFASITLPVCTVAGAVVTFVTAGNCTIQASQPGNTSYSAATPVSQTFQITSSTQTITFAALPNVVFGAAPFPITATASSGLAVVFSSTTSSVCTVSGSTVTATGVGNCLIQAAQPGSASFSAAAPVSQSFKVTQASQTITFSTIPDSYAGAPAITLTATASSGLPVAYSSSPTTVCTISGSTATVAGAGTCVIQATQPGSVNYAAAAPVSQSFKVIQNGQAITFNPIPDTVVGAPSFTLTATASSGLPVTYSSTPATVCTVSAAIATVVGAGTCVIQATQTGSSSYAAAAPVSQSFKVTLNSQAISFNSIPDALLGTPPLALTATASSGLPIAFSSTTTSVCTVSGTNVTLVLAGTCAVKASQPGNNTYAAAAPVTQSFNVLPDSQTITFAPPPDQTLGGKPPTLTATASSNLVVAFASNTVAVCAVTGVAVTLVSAGSCSIKATQPGNSTFAAAPPVTVTFNILPQSQTITFAALKNQIFGAAPFAVTAKSTSSLTVTFASTTSTVCTVSGTMVTLVTAGACTVEASQVGNTNFAPATPVDQSFTITQASQTIVFAAIKNQVYGSPPVTLSATPRPPVFPWRFRRSTQLFATSPAPPLPSSWAAHVASRPPNRATAITSRQPPLYKASWSPPRPRPLLLAHWPTSPWANRPLLYPPQPHPTILSSSRPHPPASAPWPLAW